MDSVMGMYQACTNNLSHAVMAVAAAGMFHLRRGGAAVCHSIWWETPLPVLPCTHVACVHHENAPCGLSLIHDGAKGKMLLVQGDLQGLTAAAEEEEGTQ